MKYDSLHSAERKFSFHRKSCLHLIGLLRKGMSKTVETLLLFTDSSRASYCSAQDVSPAYASPVSSNCDIFN